MRGKLIICPECGATGCEACAFRGCSRGPDNGEESFMDPMKLPDNPAEALWEIARFISAARVDRQRTVREMGVPVGFWQTDDWTEALFDLGEEAIRVARLATPPEPEEAEAIARGLPSSVSTVDHAPEPPLKPLWPFYLVAYLAFLCFLTYCIYDRY